MRLDRAHGKQRTAATVAVAAGVLGAAVAAAPISIATPPMAPLPFVAPKAAPAEKAPAKPAPVAAKTSKAGAESTGLRTAVALPDVMDGELIGEVPTTVSFEFPADATVIRPGFYFHPLTPELKARITGVSFHPNNNVSFDDLRYVKVKHFGFDGEIHNGELIVNRAIAADITNIFAELFDAQYPIGRMALVDDYGADDEASMSANNTSAFNYRVIAGTSTLSRHALGMAIDINPRVNPWVAGGRVSPANGAAYVQRDPARSTGQYRDYMIHSGDVVYRIFAKYGFSWGGAWSASKDYQHFER